TQNTGGNSEFWKPRVSKLGMYYYDNCLYATEATRRAVKQADSEDCDTVDIEHFEKILPQLLLDF
uniref:Uncharacterized protein n=1 Tax=Sinocyclocheilus anshuiensis TaxID=1608454 RepID=A0A671RZ99_9TELE